MIKYDYDKEEVKRPENFWLTDGEEGDSEPSEYGVVFDRIKGGIFTGIDNFGEFYMNDDLARELAHGILKVIGDE